MTSPSSATSTSRKNSESRFLSQLRKKMHLAYPLRERSVQNSDPSSAPDHEQLRFIQAADSHRDLSAPHSHHSNFTAHPRTPSPPPSDPPAYDTLSPPNYYAQTYTSACYDLWDGNHIPDPLSVADETRDFQYALEDREPESRISYQSVGARSIRGEEANGETTVSQSTFRDVVELGMGLSALTAAVAATSYGLYKGLR